MSEEKAIWKEGKTWQEVNLGGIKKESIMLICTKISAQNEKTF